MRLHHPLQVLAATYSIDAWHEVEFLMLDGLRLRLRGLRGATVRAAGPGARSRFPEVSVHALGWMFGWVRVGGCGSDSLEPRGVLSFL